MLVPVVVRSPSGYVEGLGRRDFRLYVEGQPVAIEGFEKGRNAPVSLVFLQDLSGSMAAGDKLLHSQEALRYFLNRTLPGDELALATFANERVLVEVPLTSDTSATAEAMELWEAYGTTAIHDAVAWLPEIALPSSNPKRAAIVVTDGVDNASRMDPATARQRVRKAELPVYVLGLETGSPYAVDRQGRKLYRYADVLNLLAHLTGGRYYSILGPYELKEACITITEELRSQYVLGFSTSSTGPVRFRELKVEVPGRKRLQVAFRRGYEGTPPRSGE